MSTLVHRLSRTIGRQLAAPASPSSPATDKPSKSSTNAASDSAFLDDTTVNTMDAHNHDASSKPDLVTLEDVDCDEEEHMSTANPSSGPDVDADSDREITYEELQFSVPSPPKHIPFPDVPQNSELLNEFIMFAYTTVAASMQFLHLYRTVWWLPESHSSHALVSVIQSFIIYIYIYKYINITCLLVYCRTFI